MICEIFPNENVRIILIRNFTRQHTRPYLQYAMGTFRYISRDNSNIALLIYNQFYLRYICKKSETLKKISLFYLEKTGPAFWGPLLKKTKTLGMFFYQSPRATSVRTPGRKLCYGGLINKSHSKSRCQAIFSKIALHSSYQTRSG